MNAPFNAPMGGLSFLSVRSGDGRRNSLADAHGNLTARYDHGLLDGSWHDLPVGSFSESGTNICTTLLTIRKAEQVREAA